MHTHRDFAFNTEVYAKGTVGYRADDVTISIARLFFGYATGTNLWFPFAVGATVGLFSERPTAESIAAAVARYRATIVTNVPTMLGKLLDLDDERRSRGESGLDLSLGAVSSVGRRGAARAADAAVHREASAARSTTASAAPRCSTSTAATGRAMSCPAPSVARSPATR